MVLNDAYSNKAKPRIYTVPKYTIYVCIPIYIYIYVYGYGYIIHVSTQIYSRGYDSIIIYTYYFLLHI